MYNPLRRYSCLRETLYFRMRTIPTPKFYRISRNGIIHRNVVNNFKIMKNLILIFFLLLSFFTYSQSPEVIPEVNKMRDAAEWSENAPGIGIFIIAGTEFDSLSDMEIQERFEKMFYETDIKVKLFIQRTKVRTWSSFSPFFPEGACGRAVSINNLENSLKSCIDRYRKLYGSVNSKRPNK